MSECLHCGGEMGHDGKCVDCSARNLCELVRGEPIQETSPPDAEMDQTYNLVDLHADEAPVLDGFEPTAYRSENLGPPDEATMLHVPGPDEDHHSATCLACRSKVRPVDRFCYNCGSGLEPIPVMADCVGCSFPGNPPTAPVCTQCGTPLRTRKAHRLG